MLSSRWQEDGKYTANYRGCQFRPGVAPLRRYVIIKASLPDPDSKILFMRLFWSAIYNFAVFPLIRVFVPLHALFNAKTRASLRGRRGLWARLDQALAGRRSGPLAWFHVASAGEYLQAMPVIQRLSADGIQCVLSLTSVSGYRWALRQQEQEPLLLGVEYLPLDSRRNMRRWLSRVRPDILVLVKFDLWPNMIWQTHRRHIPIFLISATLHPRSFRIRNAWARSFYRHVYASLQAIYAVTEDDAMRFRRSNPEHRGIKAVGDTRYDSVLDRRDGIPPPDLGRWPEQSRVMVCGSTWPGDERVLIPAMVRFLQDMSDLRCIWVPHEVDEAHLQSLERALAGVSSRRWTAWHAGGKAVAPRVLIVDTVGQLSSLYHAAHLAYVGGGFGRGVHNVMEPGAMGVPVIVGPFYQNSPEAEALISSGAGYAITDETELSTVMASLLADEKFRVEKGRQAARFIEQQAGASDQCAQRVREFLA